MTGRCRRKGCHVYRHTRTRPHSLVRGSTKLSPLRTSSPKSASPPARSGTSFLRSGWDPPTTSSREIKGSLRFHEPNADRVGQARSVGFFFSHRQTKEAIMAFGLNRVELIGRLAADAEVVTLSNGTQDRQAAHRHRRELHLEADRPARRQHRMAPGRDLPGGPGQHVREARAQRAASSSSRASSRPAAGARTVRKPTASAPRS